MELQCLDVLKWCCSLGNLSLLKGRMRLSLFLSGCFPPADCGSCSVAYSKGMAAQISMSGNDNVIASELLPML